MIFQKIRTRTAFRFIKFLLPYWWQELIVLFCVLFTTVGSLVPPYLFKIIIDDILLPKQLEWLILAISVLAGIMLAKLVVSSLSDYLYAWVNNRIVRDLRIALFNHLMTVPLNFHNQQNTGDIIFRLNHDVGVIQAVLSASALRFLHNSLTLIGLIAVLCWMNVELFLLSMVVVPFFVLNLIYFQPKIKRTVEAIQQKGSDIYSYAIERLNNIELVQLHNCYEHETSRFHSALNGLIRSIMRNAFYWISMGTISSGLATLVPVFIMGWGGYQVIQGAVTIGTLVAFLRYTSHLFGPLEDLHDLYMDLVRASVSMNRVFEFLQVPTQTETHSGQRPFIYQHAIVLRDIHLHFDDKPVLKGVDFELVKGNTYALVGASGSGKTTIANLLCGFYHPDKGHILVDGVPLQEISLYDLRQYIGLVSQNVHLFDDTIWENIRYGNFDRKPAEIKRIAYQAGLDGHLDLQGQIGEQGVQLSGGQKQRITLARTLLRQAELLILDEAAAAIDSASEQALLAHIRQLYANKTILLISHRISVVREVDEVICIADGKVVEQGRPRSLLDKQGYFWQLFQNQLEPTPDSLAQRP